MNSILHSLQGEWRFQILGSVNSQGQHRYHGPNQCCHCGEYVSRHSLSVDFIIKLRTNSSLQELSAVLFVGLEWDLDHPQEGGFSL